MFGNFSYICAMHRLKRYTLIALAYFFLAGLLGLVLRLFFVTPIPINYRFIVHTHSHIALLGWVYLGLISIFYKMYFKPDSDNRRFRYIFWFTNFTLLGMLLSFPFQGYALFSIIFSTLFLFATYLHTGFFLKYIPASFKNSFSYRCIKSSLIYLVISSIGPWAIGAVMATMGNTSIWYKLSIYFYLHFQYNAWFIFALCGIFIYLLEKASVVINKRHFQSFYFLLHLGVILSLFLSALWVEPPGIIYWLGGFGAVVQAVAFLYFFKLVSDNREKMKKIFSPFIFLLLKTTGIMLIIKVLLQLISALPYFAEVSFLYKDYVIGYLHLVFLGLVSIGLFGFLAHFKLLKLPKIVFGIYFTGFLLSEILIFSKATTTWLRLPFFAEYFTVLMIASSLMPVALAILLFINLNASQK